MCHRKSTFHCLVNQLNRVAGKESDIKKHTLKIHYYNNKSKDFIKEVQKQIIV